MPNRSWKHPKAKRKFLQAHEDNQEAVIKLPTKEKRAQEKRRQKERPNSKNGLTSSEKKNVGPTVFERTCIVLKPKAIRNPKQIIIW